jgi:hypothetical protein
LGKKPKKFAVSWSISVSKEMHDRARDIQQKWDNVSTKKFDKRFRMSDLGVIALEIGLEVVEAMPMPTVLDTIASEEISEDVLKIQVKKAKKSLRTPKTISGVTDEQVENMIRNSKGNDEE